MVIRQEKEITGINVEEEAKSYLLAGGVILLMKNPNESTKFYSN